MPIEFMILPLTLLFLIIIVLITSTFLAALKYKQPKQTPHHESINKPNLKRDQKAEDYFDTLQFMLNNRIITQDEYQKIMSKSLPYLK